MKCIAVAILLALAAQLAQAKDKSTPEAPKLTAEQVQHSRAVRAEAKLIQMQAQSALAPLFTELSALYAEADKAAPEGWCFVALQDGEQYVKIADGQNCDHVNHQLVASAPQGSQGEVKK